MKGLVSLYKGVMKMNKASSFVREWESYISLLFSTYLSYNLYFET